MPQAVDEKGDIYETDENGVPIRHLGNVNGGGGSMGTPKPAPQEKPYRWQSNDGSLMEMGPDGRPRVVFRDAPKPTGAGAAGADTAKITAKVRQEAIDKYKAAVALGSQIDRLEQLYKAGPGSTSGPAGVMDFLPTPANKTFNSYSDQFRAPVKAALGMTGGENNTAAEGKQNLGGYLPQAGDYDATIEEKINSLREMRQRSAQEAIAVLGGIPDANGNVTPIQQGQNPLAPIVGSDGVQRSQQVGAQYSGGSGGGAIATGDKSDIQIPSEMQAEFEAFLRANPRGKLDPNAYAEKRLQLNAKYGFGINPGDLQTYISEGKSYNEQPNRPFNMSIPAVKGGQTSAIDQAKGAFVTNPVGAAVTNFGNANMLGIPGAFSGGAIDAIRAESPNASFAGDLAGSLTGVAGLAKGAIKAGLTKELPKALMGSNLIYGTTRGASEMPENPFLGATVGLATSAAGEGAARVLIAPAVKAIAQSRGGQAAGNVARGIFGRRQMPVVDPLSQGDQMIVSAVGDRGPQTMGNLREAARLNLPFTLADANPNLRALAGSAVRKSPMVRQTAEDVLRPRAMGQIDRLQGAISRDFGDPTSVLTRSDELVQQAKTAAAPLYQQAYAAPAIGSPEIDSLLQTPFGRSALGRARTIAANERRDPAAMGFNLDENGDVVLNPVQTDLYGAQAAAKAEFDAANAAHQSAMIMPGANATSASARLEAARQSLEKANAALQNTPTAGVAQGASNYTPQTLDYVKRGMDDVLEQYRNPMTGKLQLDEAGRAQNDVLRSFLSEVDGINPSYGQARAAYAGPAGERSALQLGTQAPNQSADEVRYTLGNLGGNKPDQYRLGALSAISTQANRARYSVNPYETIAGSPEARNRLGVLFPGGAPNFTRQADLEGEMSRTFTEALGGSQTAPRGAADQAFDASPAMTLGIDAANAVATGSPPVATMARLGGNFLKDSYRLGLGQAKANQLGPVLLNPDAAQAAAIFADIRKNAMKAGMLGKKAKKQGKTVGDITASFMAPVTSAYLLGQ